MTATFLNTKISEVSNKSRDNYKYITTQEFNKLTTKGFEAKLNQPDLVNKTDLDNELTSFYQGITLKEAK